MAIPLAVLAIVVAMAMLWPPSVRAAQPVTCATGLPAELSAQLQPLMQALAEATAQSLDCSSSAADPSGQSTTPTQSQRDLQLIAQTLALLAMADPGYAYGYGSYGYSAPANAPPSAARADSQPPPPACDSAPEAPPDGGSAHIP